MSADQDVNDALKAQHQIVQMMRDTLNERQMRRGSYSLRAFAHSLKLTPAELSEVFSGKRKITRKMAKKVFSSLSVDPQREHRLMSGLPEKQVRRKRSLFAPQAFPASTKIHKRVKSSDHGPVRSFIQLSTDEFRVVADWYYLAILSLGETESFRPDTAWISKRLGITKYEAKGAVEALIRLGLLAKDGRAGLRVTGKQFTTTNDVPDSSIRKNHAQSLELALDALESVPIELREFSGMVIAADPDLLPEAKKRIRELRREIMEILESGKKKEVYRLSVQLFPLSQAMANQSEGKSL
ncbi:MAG: DUF4423 domain-containing protein [Oligoflexia bacterium]|nr:DUF4423 domain-containing protein [Oligoflexia bacterium]